MKTMNQIFDESRLLNNRIVKDKIGFFGIFDIHSRLLGSIDLTPAVGTKASTFLSTVSLFGTHRGRARR